MTRRYGQKLTVQVELASGARAGKNFPPLLAERLVHHLRRNNIEYRKLHDTIGEQAYPQVVLKTFGQIKSSINARGVLALKGKKPKIVLQ